MIPQCVSALYIRTLRDTGRAEELGKQSVDEVHSSLKQHERKTTAEEAEPLLKHPLYKPDSPSSSSEPQRPH